MKVGRALLISALVHGGLLLALILDPGNGEREAPDAAREAALVWMEMVAPAPRVTAPAPAPRVTAPAPAPVAVARSTGTNIAARAVPEVQAHAAAVAPAARRRPQAAPVALPDGADSDGADNGGADSDGADSGGPAVPAGAIPGLALPGSLLPGPVADMGRVSGDGAGALPTGALPAAPAPAFDARAYGEHIRRRIAAHEHYPARARRLGLEGVAVVIVAVDARGHLARPPRLADSSGVAALDHEALRMARAAAPFPPPARPDARPTPLVVHVPVRFSLAGAP